MKWFTVREAAKKIGVTEAHVRRLISGNANGKSGKPKLKAKRVGGKIWMVSEQVIETYLRKKRQPNLNK